MTDTPQPNTPPSEEIPVAAVTPRRLSTTWLIPLAALVLVGVLLVIQIARARGPVIEIRFQDAAGIAPGAEIIHRGLGVGLVRDIHPTESLDAVLVTAELLPEAAGLAVEGTAFWVVRPEVSLQRVAGLDTLIGPRYIAVRPGPRDAAPQDSFVGLENPPRLGPAPDGTLRLTLRAARLGSIAPGSPVLYREVRVGTVRDAELSPDASGVLIAIDIEPRYAPLVWETSRFWRVGGVGVDFGIFSGLTVRADSLDQFISAGIAFATPQRLAPPAAPGTVFDLADQPDSAWLGWTPAIPLAAPGQPNATINP